MTLAVPIGVVVGGRRVTSEVQAVAFTKNAVGGVQSVSFKLARPLSAFDAGLSAFSDVYLYDARNAETIAQARLTDTGRSVSSSDGQVWELTAFGPAQHASDIAAPLVYVDQSITDGWRQVDRVVKGATISQSTKPGNSSDTAPECVVMHFPEGTTLATNDWLKYRYERLRECGQFIGRVSWDWDAGSTDADYRIRIWTSVDGTGGSAVGSNTFNTAGGTENRVVVTDITNGRNVVDLMCEYTGAAGKPGTDNKWGSFDDVVIRARLVDQDGSSITTGYTADYVLAHEVVKDLLGQLLPQYDGANATVDTGATHQIDALTYVDGATPEQILDDLMALEPAYRWTTGPDTTGSGYSFSWEPWPTRVRYEATLDDGGSFPASWQEVYNKVKVRYRDKRGRVRSVFRTVTDVGLDDPLPYTRRYLLDVGDDIGSANGATRVGDNFLTDHNVPANAGTITINRPIRDTDTGRMVLPHEIEPGHLIRVRGVESYADALNADSNDGRTVFRIWSMTYSSDTDSASLELDTFSRTTANALKRLMKKRGRKR